VAGALDWILAQPGVDPWRVSLVGYSFGAWVGLSHAQNDPRPAAVAAVGLAAWHYDADFYKAKARHDLGVEPWQLDPGFLQTFTRPKVFVAGEHDPLAPPVALKRLVDRIPEPKTLHVVAGTDHFFRGYEQVVGNLIACAIAAL
jgi:alpha/beta superfamily hydrolase